MENKYIFSLPRKNIKYKTNNFNEFCVELLKFKENTNRKIDEFEFIVEKEEDNAI